MNKKEVAARLRQTTGLQEEDVDVVVETVLTSIKQSLTRGENVTLFRFGTFAVKKRRARTIRNPRTGEAFKAPAKSYATFRPGQVLRDRIQETVLKEERN